MEIEIARNLPDSTDIVAYDRSEPINYPLLQQARLPMPRLTTKDLKALGWSWSETECRSLMEQAEQMISPYHAAMRAYVGWLVTDPAFIGERDALFADWASPINSYGIPQPGPTTDGAVPEGLLFKKVRGKQIKGCLDAFDTFYARWRLQRMVTPHLPEPLAPQVPNWPRPSWPG